ncbi:MAG: cell surface protein [Lachnospiraceae bacterium]|nr:cell surface protein [Lachnospiraceae bacterium]
MRKLKPAATLIVVLLLLLLVKNTVEGRNYTIQKAGNGNVDEGLWSSFISANINSTPMTMETNGKAICNVAGAFMSENLDILIPVKYANEVFDCSAVLYSDNLLRLERNEVSLELTTSGIGKGGIYDKEGTLYVSTAEVCKGLNLSYEFDMEKNKLTVLAKDLGARAIPYKYDMRETLRAPKVRNQGRFGTCWAFSALSALESSLLPAESLQYSVDHMTYNNSFNLDINTGGAYTMGMAYLVNWQGPVLEREDPYGDNQTNSNLKAVKHVQEIRMIGEKNYDAIKEAVYKFGAVQTSIYNSLANEYSTSPHYNKAKSAYCYRGTEKSNHEIIIVGWDDNYSRTNFAQQPEADGAFICQNSWGTGFGENGYFYVSYYDTNIGVHNLVYTSIEEPDNYGNIYQSDLCGWVGQIGFNNPTACAMNVYTAKSDETVEAAGFYAVGADTKYEVYVVDKFAAPEDVKLRNLKPAASGTLNWAGFYTIPIKPVEIKGGDRFAIIVKLTVPNAVHPIAIEYQGNELSKNADLSDGEGYVSYAGEGWVNTEETHKSNLCLKAYTNNKSN